MNNALILDIIFGALLVLSILVGAKRGLFKSLMALVVIIVSLIGASVLANMFTDQVTEYVTPQLEEKAQEWLSSQDGTVSSIVSNALSSDSDKSDAASGLLGKLEKFGALDTFVDSAKSSASDAASTAVQSLIRTVVHAALLLIFYVVLFIVLKLISKLLNHAVENIPVVRTVNDLGGILLSFAECVAVLYLFCYLAPRLGIKFYIENVDQTHIVSFFATHSPGSLLSILSH